MAGFLASLKPSNPVDAGKLETIKQIAQRVGGRFTSNYLNCLKDELIENAEKKQLKEEAKRLAEEKRAAKGPTEQQPRRPRGTKPTKKNKDKISAKVANWEKLDEDIDPYVSYIVVSSYKTREATKSRRYKEFKLLNKKLGKKVPADAHIPGASSAFGARNLHKDFLKDRKKNLTHYLKALTEVEALTKEPEFLKFLGLVKSDDPLGDKVFDHAIERTKWDLWVWKKIVWDTQGEAISKLVVEEIRKEMWYDIVQACPPSEAARKVALKLAYRSVSVTVGPVVTATWNAAAEQAKPLRKKVEEVLGQQFDKIVQVKAEIKGKLKAGMAAALAPIVEQIERVVGNILRQLIPPLVEALQPAVEKAPDINTKLNDAIMTMDIEKARDIRDIVHDTKKHVYKKMEDAIQKQIEAMVGECSKDLAHDALKLLLSPFSKIIDIANSLIELIDPENYMDVIVFLMKQKDEIAKTADPSKIDEVQQKLDWEEWDAAWRTRWRGYEIRSAGRELWWDLSTLLVDLGPVPDAFWELSCDIQKYLHKRMLKKFSWKFGDYLYGAMTNASDTRDWPTKCNESFIIGYRKAMKCARKNILALVSKYAIEFVKRPVLAPIQKVVIPLIKEVIDPLESLIPEPLRDLLDISGMVTACIIESVSEAVAHIVLAQGPVCAQELLKLGISL
ncbi:hypothetical protein Pelo_13594 [Pelomyxa schiedti]|nr:hypothetical protein Pelo_13594 [Pelomyxa schiedti]